MNRDPLHFSRLVRSRSIRVAMLVFELVWLNAIVPGHRRGIVSLPGDACSNCRQVETARCCEAGRTPPRSRRAPADPAGHCAICFFAARLSPPAAVDFTHPPLQRVALAAPQAFVEKPSTRPHLRLQSRAPPTLPHPIV